jgi:Outer membrane protein beta-barrel domain
MRTRVSLLLLAIMLVARTAGAVSVGAEVFGGLSLPVLQPTSDQGSQFGVRLPVRLIPMLGVEPFFVRSKPGDKTETLGGISYVRDGGQITGYGVNLRLGGVGVPGIGFFPYAGVGSYKLERTGSADETDVGYDLGLGLQLSPAPKFAISLRGEVDALVTGSTSRKFANITVGASYNFLSLP